MQKQSGLKILIAENLKELLKEHNVTQSHLANAIGFSQRAVSKWINAQAEPTETAIVSCAQFFNISADEILGMNEKNTQPTLSPTFSTDENELLKFYRKASDFQKSNILSYAQFICTETEKK